MALQPGLDKEALNGPAPTSMTGRACAFLIAALPFIPLVEFYGALEREYLAFFRMVLIELKHLPDPRYPMVVFLIAPVLGLVGLMKSTQKAHIMLAAGVIALSLFEILLALTGEGSGFSLLAYQMGLEGYVHASRYGIHAALQAALGAVWFFSELKLKGELRSRMEG